MADSESRWHGYDLYPEGIVHAIGVVSFNFNWFERWLYYIFEHHLGQLNVPLELILKWFGQLKIEERTGTLEFIYSLYEKDPLIKDHVKHLIKYFSRCRENRNVILHSNAQPINENTVAFYSKAKTDWAKSIYRDIDLSRVRGVADEIETGIKYAVAIFWYLAHRDIQKLVEKGLVEPRTGDFSGTLPEKPPLPDILPETLPPGDHRGD